jgi:hypothetical protein
MDSLLDLIDAAQALLGAGFDVQQFLAWKSLAFLSLLGILGPLHYYTKTFCRVTENHDHVNLLAGKGVLVAIKEGLSQASEHSHMGSHSGAQDGKSMPPLIKRCVGKACSLRLAQEAYRGE